MTIEVGNANNGIPMGAYVPSSGGSGGGAGSLKAVVVDTLPETGEEGILYLVPEQSSAGTNNFKEYIWLPDENKYEELGYTDIDLSDYYTKEELDNEFNSLSSTVTNLTTSKQDVLTAGDNITIENNVISATVSGVGQATSTTLGTVKANAKQDTDTQEVRIDSTTGLLYTAPGLPDVIDGGNAGSIAAVRYGISQAASFGRKYNNSLSTITDSWEEITQ